MRPIIPGVEGAGGSGKTTVVRVMRREVVIVDTELIIPGAGRGGGHADHEVHAVLADGE